MRLAVLKERHAYETRVAATPETVKKLVGMGLEVAIESGAGLASAISDADYQAAGAVIAPDAAAALAGAGIVFAVQVPEPEQRGHIARGTLLICTAGAFGNPQLVTALAEAGIDTAAMELLPRITRAQSMDILSSQANLAGYRAVIEAAGAFERGFPMMMTAAGTVPPARVFVIGAGVAGLQAIATARRLGAIVTATDVRPATKEQVESLGAKFVAVEDEEFKQAETAGGYAKEMSEAYKQKQAALVATHIAKQDIVITTALIPGRPAPKLVSTAMVDSMRPGSIVFDLAVERGGNCELAQAGAVVDHNGVKIVGYLNVPGRLAATASALYARNLFAFVETLIDPATKTVKVDPADDLVKATCLTRDGAVIHPSFQPKAA
jgi:NAD(P) transhydrogenase subunit alpha